MSTMLPKELELKVLEYLIFNNDLKKIRIISKHFSNLIEQVKFVREKNNIENIALMVLEDKKEYRFISNQLGGKWEFYHKWDWPLPRYSFNLKCDWKINDYVDAEDYIGVWGCAKILQKRIYNDSLEFEVHFLGWSDKFNEWIKPDKIRYMGTKTINPRDKFRSIKGHHKRWCLYHMNNKWLVGKLTLLNNAYNNNYEKEVTIYIFSEGTDYYDKLTPKNIDLKVRALTNATVLLSINNSNLEISHRFLKF